MTREAIERAVRARWGILTAYRFGLFVGQMGLTFDNPYHDQTKRRRYSQGVLRGRELIGELL